MTKKLSFLLALFLMTFFVIQPASAATLTWDPMVNSTFSSGVRSPGFGDNDNIFTLSMVTFNDYVYVSNFNAPTGTGGGTEIWRSSNGTDWEQVNEDNFGGAATASYAMLAVFNNNLYAFNWLLGDDQVDVYQYSSGTVWTNVETIGDGQTAISQPTATIVYDNSLYVSLIIDDGGNDKSAIYGSADGTTWTSVNSDGFGDVNEVTESLAVYNNYLYAGAYNSATGTEVWRYDGASWVQDNSDGFDGDTNDGIGSLTSFGGALYASTTNAVTGSEVWATTGGGPSDWEKVSDAGFGQNTNIVATSNSAVFKGKLYIGAVSNDGAKVFRTSDGSSYEQVNNDGFGFADNIFVIFTVSGDYLYAGTGTLSRGVFVVQDGAPETTEIYRYYEPTTLPETGVNSPLNAYILDALM